MSSWMIIWICFSTGYLLGSIPFAVLIAMAFGKDIFKVGSGNPGATNLGRAVGAKWGIFCLLLDMLKGTLVIVLAKLYFIEPQFVILAGIGALIGHSFSVFLKFKGGKGAATGYGVLLGIHPGIALVVAGVVLLIVWMTRYQSLATLTAVSLVPPAMYVLKLDPYYFYACIVMVVLIWFRHRSNVIRLLKGEENKVEWFNLRKK